MSTIAKLRALHEEVCHCWRNHHLGCVSEGEAEILNLGFKMLERLIEVLSLTPSDNKLVVDIMNNHLIAYFNRVRGQFDDDADIVIKGDKPRA